MVIMMMRSLVSTPITLYGTAYGTMSHSRLAACRRRADDIMSNAILVKRRSAYIEHINLHHCSKYMLWLESYDSILQNPRRGAFTRLLLPPNIDRPLRFACGGSLFCCCGCCHPSRLLFSSLGTTISDHSYLSSCPYLTPYSYHHVHSLHCSRPQDCLAQGSPR
jgi:hypothetical protein